MVDTRADSFPTVASVAPAPVADTQAQAQAQAQAQPTPPSVRDCLGAFGECCYHLEFWQARKAEAKAALEAAHKAATESKV